MATGATTPRLRDAERTRAEIIDVATQRHFGDHAQPVVRGDDELLRAGQALVRGDPFGGVLQIGTAQGGEERGSPAPEPDR